MNPRRHAGRRHSDSFYPIVDWHSSRVFALVITIVGLCVLDAAMTVLLMSQGASELNPLMALFLPNELGWFMAVKMSLTGLGAFVLVACSRMRLFRTIPGEFLLYGVLAAYIALIAYQLQMLELAPLHSL